MKREIILSALLLLLIITFSSALCSAIGVQPLTVDLNLRPGETGRFNLYLSPSGRQENVRLQVYQPAQAYHGNLVFLEADPAIFPEVTWVSLPAEMVTVPANQSVEVPITITVPFGASGSHIITIMVEPEPEMGTSHVAIQVRYAVRVIVRVIGPSLPVRGELSFLRLEKDEQGRQLITAEINNPSHVDFEAEVEVTIRGENRSLIERLNLRTQPGHTNNTNVTRIYPGAKVLFTNYPERYLPPGTYYFSAILKYGERGQSILNETVTIEPGDFEPPHDDAVGTIINVKPARIEASLDPKKRQTGAIEIFNASQEQIYVKVTPAEFKPGYAYSAHEWLQVYGIGDSIRLAPMQPGRFILTLQVPADAEPGGYYANLRLTAYRDPELTQVVEELLTPVICIVSKGTTPSLSAESIEANQDENKVTFTLHILNDGRIHILPSAKLSLLDANNGLVLTTDLKNAELERLYPGDESFLVGEYIGALNAGEYTAEIELLDNGKSFQKVQIPITLEGN